MTPTEPCPLGGRTAIVTGAGSGIGAATVQRLAADGATVVAADVDGAAARAVAERVGRGVHPAEVDVSDERSVVGLVELARELGPPAMLVNVAGIGSTTTVVDTSVETFDDVMAVNVRGTFLCCKHVLPDMIAAERGVIVNIASVAGLVGLRSRAAYCASKGAVVALTRAIAIDHVGQGIRANCICPGTVDSPWVRRLVDEQGESLDALRARQPMGRLGTPEEIADAVMYLVDDRSAFVTGSSLVIDGGWTAT